MSSYSQSCLSLVFQACNIIFIFWARRAILFRLTPCTNPVKERNCTRVTAGNSFVVKGTGAYFFVWNTKRVLYVVTQNVKIVRADRDFTL